jgi:hypothetical protein
MTRPLPGPGICACGRDYERKGRRNRCDYCRASDPHRNGSRRERLPEMFVSVDSETEWCPEEGRQRIVTLSYGREDGTSESFVGHDSRALYKRLVETLNGVYTDAAGKRWKHAAVAFHFNHDIAVLGNDIDPADLMLIRKVQHKIETSLCGTNHSQGVPCEYDTRVSEEGEPTSGALHRFSPSDNELVITDGMLGDLLAWHRPSHLGMAGSAGQGLYLEIRPHGDRFEDWKRLVIRDTGRSFHGGLESVIDQWNPDLSTIERERIAWGKRQREVGFAGASSAEIAAYSEAECVAHARVCRKLITAVGAAAHVRIRPSQLAGSGSIAAAVLRHYGVAKHSETHEDSEADILARMTYYGGLIEAPVVGFLDEDVDGADINSAYPSKMISMSCMRAGHGAWKVSRGTVPDSRIGHALVTWDVSRSGTSTPPFTVRRKSGAVASPLAGRRTWVSLAELQAAMPWFVADIVVHRVIHWQPTCECEEPLFFLSELYDRRLEIKDSMRAMAPGSVEWEEASCLERAIKLIINAIYGKLAQMRYGVGPYTNLHYASYITGSTRGQVRTRTWEVERAGGTVVYQHTDSVLTVGAPVVDEGTALGVWGREKSATGFLVIQPGLAISLFSNVKVASRGVRVRDFTLAAWNWYQKTDLTQHPDTWPLLVTEQQVMITRRQAIARGKPRLAGSFENKHAESRVTSSKRNYSDAQPVPGNPCAWSVPPVDFIWDQADVSDLREHMSVLDRRRRAGEFDEELAVDVAHKV